MNCQEADKPIMSSGSLAMHRHMEEYVLITCKTEEPILQKSKLEDFKQTCRKLKDPDFNKRQMEAKDR